MIKYFRYLQPSDSVNLLFLIILSLINLIHNSRVQFWYALVISNIILFVLILSLISIYESRPESEKNNPRVKYLKTLRYFYPVFLILYFFKEVYVITHSINPNDCDIALINIDYSMFGVNPTEWIYRFENPLITEFLQVIYSLYYIIILAYGLELYLWRRYREFMYAVFVILTGFYLSYILYIIFPAIGPRFYLHDFSSINKELPGIFLTEWLREFLNFAESIPKYAPNPQDFVQRDAMPSAHTEIVIILAYLSYKIKSKSFYFYITYCILMIISTIYLRYHYIIDVIAGTVLAIVTVMICKIAYKGKINSNI
ncbi:MAG: phosphatase PAP2 family protein [Ignavibacteria bacterium]